MISHKIHSSDDIDMMKCAEQAGGNHYEMVLMVAARAKEIRQHLAKKKMKETVHNHCLVTALDEMQHGLVGREYLTKAATRSSDAKPGQYPVN